MLIFTNKNGFLLGSRGSYIKENIQVVGSRECLAKDHAFTPVGY